MLLNSIFLCNDEENIYFFRQANSFGNLPKHKILCIQNKPVAQGTIGQNPLGGIDVYLYEKWKNLVKNDSYRFQSKMLFYAWKFDWKVCLHLFSNVTTHAEMHTK